MNRQQLAQKGYFMDSDIVLRLKNQTPYGLEDYDVLIDAAVEIEQLRRNRQSLVARIEYLHQLIEEIENSK